MKSKSQFEKGKERTKYSVNNVTCIKIISKLYSEKRNRKNYNENYRRNEFNSQTAILEKKTRLMGNEDTQKTFSKRSIPETRKKYEKFDPERNTKKNCFS